MIKQILLLLLFFGACTSIPNRPSIQSPDTGVLYSKLRFNDSSGNTTFSYQQRIWYRDSVVIEEVVMIHSETDTSDKTTVSYPVELYKYIDLVNRSWYDYRTFSDTARIVRSGILPDSVIRGSEWRGWAFYTNSVPMKNEPKLLTDTIIGNVKYMRIKFSKLKSNISNSYVIGYLRCDNKGKLFSFEKVFSNKVNCPMTRYDEFMEGALHPFASSELEFLSDTLSQDESKLFNAWRGNQLKFPVR